MAPKACLVGSFGRRPRIDCVVVADRSQQRMTAKALLRWCERAGVAFTREVWAPFFDHLGAPESTFNSMTKLTLSRTEAAKASAGNKTAVGAY